MEVCHEINDAKQCPKEGARFEIGVIETSDEYSEENVKNDIIKKWVSSGSARKVVNVTLNLDMEKNVLKISHDPPKNLFARSKLKFCRKTDSVFPFFSVNCPHCSLTICKINS